jgi:hypothetical protein
LLQRLLACWLLLLLWGSEEREKGDFGGERQGRREDGDNFFSFFFPASLVGMKTVRIFSDRIRDRICLEEF